MNVETVTTSSRNKRTIISRRLAIGATVVELITTDSTVLVTRRPLPSGDAEKAIYLDVHLAKYNIKIAGRLVEAILISCNIVN